MSIAAPRLAIDVRMMNSSGIGRYIRQVVPLVSRLPGGPRIALLGDPVEVGQLGLGPENASRGTVDPQADHGTRAPAGVDAAPTIHSCRAAIYSAREQIEIPRATPVDVDVFWSPHYNFPILSPARLVVTVHDTLHIARPEYVRGPHRRLYARLMFAQLRQRAHAIICVSRFTAEELMRHAGVDANRIEVIHQGVDPEWFDVPAGRSPHPRPYFLYVGNVKPHKNLRRLIEAFEITARDVPHDLLIVGRKDGLLGGDDVVQSRAAALGSRVAFTGEVDDEVLKSLVASAEALVLPSRYEGFGLPALEAMAAGCPALVARAAALPEVCGDAALYFGPDDVAELAACLARIVRDRPLRDDLIAAGRHRARMFTWDTCARHTREVLDQALRT
jgi:glycosyltransferase involved in cell wall biosynthesis